MLHGTRGSKHILVNQRLFGLRCLFHGKEHIIAIGFHLLHPRLHTLIGQKAKSLAIARQKIHSHIAINGRTEIEVKVVAVFKLGSHIGTLRMVAEWLGNEIHLRRCQFARFTFHRHRHHHHTISELNIALRFAYGFQPLAFHIRCAVGEKRGLRFRLLPLGGVLQPSGVFLRNQCAKLIGNGLKFGALKSHLHRLVGTLVARRMIHIGGFNRFHLCGKSA